MKKLLLILGLSALVFGVETKDFQFLTEGSTKIKRVHYDKNFKKLIVYVKDDGTKRDGYAGWVAMELKDHGFTKKDIEWVFVKDVKTTKKQQENGDGIVFGRAPMVY